MAYNAGPYRSMVYDGSLTERTHPTSCYPPEPVYQAYWKSRVICLMQGRKVNFPPLTRLAEKLLLARGGLKVFEERRSGKKGTYITVTVGRQSKTVHAKHADVTRQPDAYHAQLIAEALELLASDVNDGQSIEDFTGIDVDLFDAMSQMERLMYGLKRPLQTECNRIKTRAYRVGLSSFLQQISAITAVQERSWFIENRIYKHAMQGMANLLCWAGEAYENARGWLLDPYEEVAC